MEVVYEKDSSLRWEQRGIWYHRINQIIMKNILLLTVAALVFFSCTQEQTSRITEDFNQNWKFNFGDNPEAYKIGFNDTDWRELSVPHDWSIEEGYFQHTENTAASTGFVKGGIGWYRKAFQLNASDEGKQITVIFDGVYNNSTVWINGVELGFRPNGYSSFSYDLSQHLNYDGSDNILAVKVDRSTYADSRWYTGSGIYRKVQLIKKAPLHIAQWGVQVTTPDITTEKAKVSVKTLLENSSSEKAEDLSLSLTILCPAEGIVCEREVQLGSALENVSELEVAAPLLWDVENPNLYTLKVLLLKGGKTVDATTEQFGIRSFNFDANKGFYLNGKSMKIKGVNLHHDAGAVGAAVPKAVWEYRVDKLKSIGCNAIRMAHNPHSVELMEVCDEKGMLVMAEAFDEWHKPKGKNLVYIGDNAAKGLKAKSYPESFKEWAERDLKDLIKRDFNHPSVIMWSIGNEIEWTFPHYSKTYSDVNGKTGAQGYVNTPNYDNKTVTEAFKKNIEGEDELAATAKQLVAWVKEIDTSRPVTAGSVLPSVSMASGYGTAVDVFGFNYRAADYDAAHKEYPDLKILGSENWGSYGEWKSINERDFVAGIFTWTGFAYLGEAGPWPRKGLEIAFFDYAGFKTARGHFFECLWKPEPKVYMVTTPASESEFSFSKKDGWKFDMQYTAPPVWRMLRKWEWYKTNPHWNYKEQEDIIVQTYTNCEEAELFLNGSSLGKQKRADFAEDNIIKWLVPYGKGELKVIGFNKGEKVSEYTLNTSGLLAKIAINSTKTELTADGYDVAIISAELLDEKGKPITTADQKMEFEILGAGRNIGIDNGWEMSVEPHKTNSITTYQGRAIVHIQSTKESGEIKIVAKSGNISSDELVLISN